MIDHPKGLRMRLRVLPVVKDALATEASRRGISLSDTIRTALGSRLVGGTGRRSSGSRSDSAVEMLDIHLTSHDLIAVRQLSLLLRTTEQIAVTVVVTAWAVGRVLDRRAP